MIFVLDQAVLVKELSFLRRATPKAETLIAWLSMTVPADYREGAVILIAANNRCSLETVLTDTSMSRQSGTFSTSSLVLDKIIETLAGEQILFEQADRSMTMRWSTGSCRVMAPWAPVAPLTAQGEIVRRIELDPAAFVALVSTLRFSFPATHEYRIPGLRFQCDEQQLHVTSTNGAVFGVMRQNMRRATEAASFVLPVLVCEDILAMIRENKSEPLILSFYQKHLRAACGHRACTFTYVEQPTFPNLDAILNAEMSLHATVPVAPALQAVRRAVAASGYDTNETGRVLIEMTPGAVKLRTLDCQEVIGSYEGEPVSIVVNSRNLAGVLSAIPTPTVQINGTAAHMPWLFKGDDTAQFILAPMSRL